MSFKSKRITTAIALFLVFATTQIYVGASFAGPVPVVPGAGTATAPQQPTGILTPQGGRAITVNGTDAITGATIVSGAKIETPAGVGATVNLGSQGWLDAAPRAIFTLTFDGTGSVNVFLTQGCVVLHTRKNTTGQIETVNGVIGKSDPTKDDVLRVCSERGAVPPPGIGGTGGAAAGAGGAATTAGSTTGAVIVGAAVMGGVFAAAILVPCRRGRNPSPGEPRGRNDECR